MQGFFSDFLSFVKDIVSYHPQQLYHDSENEEEER
jgi:hypothetical protein